MLVLEPNKRYSISQIKKHRWMQMSIPPSLPPLIPASPTQPNEQILRLMQSLGIDSSKTREVLNSHFPHYFIFNFFYNYSRSVSEAMITMPLFISYYLTNYATNS